MELRPIHGHFGAEVLGVDLGAGPDAATIAKIEEAWLAHSFLLFRGVRMTPEQQIAMTRRLGPLHIMRPLQYNLPGHPEIFVVANLEDNGRPLGMRRVGLGWHTDGEDKAIPNAGSFLYALIIPLEGGDTWFADMYAAYAGLPEGLKRKIAGRRARYSRIEMHAVHYPGLPPLTAEQKAERPDVFHPLVRRHPRSGRPALYIGRWACDVEGLPAEDGRALIGELQEFAARDAVVYRHRWRVHDALLWDNRCMLHCAQPFDDARHQRCMHRTTLEGDLPLMASVA